jgi:hypothetical protein
MQGAARRRHEDLGFENSEMRGTVSLRSRQKG